MQIGIQVDEPFQERIEYEWLRGLVEQVLVAQSAGAATEVGCLITDDDTVHALNKEYRDVDSSTDVLAFALSESEEGVPVFPDPDGLRHLGEVIVSYPQAARQAEERRHPVLREVALLVIHGLLHLLGYDHETPEQEAAMRQAEQARLRAFLGEEVSDSAEGRAI